VYHQQRVDLVIPRRSLGDRIVLTLLSHYNGRYLTSEKRIGRVDGAVERARGANRLAHGAAYLRTISSSIALTITTGMARNAFSGPHLRDTFDSAGDGAS
jgi:hypothetical protein